MTLEQYRKETLRTLPDLGSLQANSLHMTVGILTEIGELIELPFIYDNAYDEIRINKEKDELFDCFWYMSNYANLHDLKFFEVVNTKYMPYHPLELTNAYIISAAKLLDIDKKSFAYGKSYSKEDRQKAFSELYTHFRLMVEQFGFDMEECMEKNIAKIRVRFPEKFDPHLAINRDTNKENQVYVQGVSNN